MKRARRLAVPAVMLAAVFGGLGPIFGKLALRQFTPFSVLVLRYGFALLILIPLLFLRKEHSIRRGDVFPLFGLSFLWVGNVIGFIIGLQYTTAIVAALVYLLVPLIVLVLSRIFFNERFVFSQFVGVFLGISGGLLILVRSFSGQPEEMLFSTGTVRGNLVILLAVLSWSAYLVFSKRVLLRSSPLAITTYSGLFALVFSIPFFLRDLTAGHFPAAPVGIDGVVGIAGQVLLLSVAMLFLYQWGIKHSSSFTAASVSYLQPLTASALAIPLFGERLTESLLVSAGLIFLSVYLTTIHPLVKRRAEKQDS